jgi:hypothetical protein
MSILLFFIPPVGVACCALYKARNSATPGPTFDATPHATATQRRNGRNARLAETEFPAQHPRNGESNTLEKSHATATPCGSLSYQPKGCCMTTKTNRGKP